MGMTVSGWIFFSIGLGFIATLSIYCFSKVLRIEAGKPKKQ